VEQEEADPVLAVAGQLPQHNDVGGGHE
jgi:hypothetical protein